MSVAGLFEGHEKGPRRLRFGPPCFRTLFLFILKKIMLQTGQLSQLKIQHAVKSSI